MTIHQTVTHTSATHISQAIGHIQTQIALLTSQSDPNGFRLPCLSLDLAIAELHLASQAEDRA